MTTYVLIPGGWHGGWAYSEIVARLASHGHRAIAPSLSGLADRRHLANFGVNLNTHIEDITNLLNFEDLEDVVLCGHSYGGMIVSGVCDRVPQRIRARVYLDAYVPKTGDSCWALAGEAYREIFLAGLSDDGLSSAPPERLLQRDARVTPHPFASLVQEIHLTGAIEKVPHKGYLLALDHDGSPFTSVYQEIRSAPGWRTVTLNCRHNVMAALPEEVVNFLLEFA